MYDTIKFDKYFYNSRSDPSRVVRYLRDVKPSSDTRWISEGWLGNNMRVKLRQNEISVSGSLSKYLLGSNAYTLTSDTAADAFEKMCDELHLNIMDANVRRIDFATCLQTDLPVMCYYQLFGDKARFSKVRTAKETLEYYKNRRSAAKTSSPEFVIYDKIAEMKSKGNVIPSEFVGQNLLRMEMRLIGSLSKRLGWAEVAPSQLVCKNTYEQLVKMWGDWYFSIPKIGCNINDDVMRKAETPKKLTEILLADLLNKRSDRDNYIESAIYHAALMNGWDAKKCRMAKKKFNEILFANSTSDNGGMIEELDEKVRMIVENAR